MNLDNLKNKPWVLDNLILYYPLTIEQIHNNKDIIDFKILSKNTNLEWDEELIDKFNNLWNWYRLIRNSGIKWDSKILIKYYHKINEDDLSYILKNSNFYINEDFIEKFKDIIDWSLLCTRINIIWNEKLIERYYNE